MDDCVYDRALLALCEHSHGEPADCNDELNVWEYIRKVAPNLVSQGYQRVGRFFREVFNAVFLVVTAFLLSP